MRLNYLFSITTAVMLLAAPTDALANCCDFSASGACNVFGCNCDGPCSNFGVSCAHGPTSVSGEYVGFCQGYDWCPDLSGFCGNNLKCTGKYCSNCGGSRELSEKTGENAQQPAQPVKQMSRLEVRASDSWLKQTPADRFKSIDTDKNGNISSKEFMAWATKNVGSMSKADGNKEFKQLDKNNNGIIDIEEFDADLAKDKATKK